MATDPLSPVWDVLPPEDATALKQALAPLPDSGAPPLEEVDGDPAPWLRREDEMLKEYTGFQRYLSLGSGRTIGAFCRQQAAVDHPGGMQGTWRYWKAVAERLDWGHRAAAYDEYQAGLELAAYREERLKLRRERQAVLRAYLRVIAGQVQKLGASQRLTADFSDVTAALRVVMSELRTEYLDQPEDRLLDQGRDGKPVVQFTDIQAFMVRMRTAIGED